MSLKDAIYIPLIGTVIDRVVFWRVENVNHVQLVLICSIMTYAAVLVPDWYYGTRRD